MGYLVNWYEWNTRADFDLWHDALCQSLGYPIIGTNQATGEPDPTAQMTVAYTQAIEVEGKWIANVEIEHADGLIETNLRLPKPDFLRVSE
jgi:hypothetical protein